jgi:hypothetical protein
MMESDPARMFAHGKYSVRYLPVASVVPIYERLELASWMDLLTDQIWDKDPQLFHKMQDSLFSDDDGLMIISLNASNGSIVGFLSFRRLKLDDAHTLFLNFINILPMHHGSGLYAFLARELIRDHRTWAGRRPLFYCWRTRNPVMWFANARLCTRIMPDLLDGRVDAELCALAARAARQIYPHNSFDPTTFGMSDSYPEGHGYKRSQHHSLKHLNDRFYNDPALACPNAALFGFGELAPLRQGSFAEP